MAERVVDLMIKGHHITYYDKEKTKINVDSNYNNDGLLNGSYTQYWENGNIMIKENYLNGKRNGVSEYYLEDSTKVAEYTWENGVIKKCRTTNYLNRNVWDTFSLDGWEFNGPFETYTQYNNLIRTGSYLENRYTGTVRMWYYDSTYKILENIYHDGMKVMKDNTYWDMEGNITQNVTYESNGYKLTARRYYYGMYANGNFIDFTFDKETLDPEVVILKA